MKPLVVLALSFLLSSSIVRLAAKQWDFILAGNIAMCTMLCFTSIGHFAAARHIDYEKANFNGSGLNYLWFRVPLQILFIGWVWYFGIKN